jgi:DMSO/TMAO reductase YedYZ molybdopterin-dependent catalytic subunit
MKKASKIVIVLFALLIVAAVPLYYYTRPIPIEAGSLQIKGNVNNPENLTFSQLQAFNATTIQVTLTSSGNPTDNGVFNYTGVLIKDLLSQAQASANASSVYIQASDGYGTTLSIQEILNQNALIAYAKDGSPLTSIKSGGEGPLRLIIGGDVYAQRWVKSVVSIEVT